MRQENWGEGRRCTCDREQKFRSDWWHRAPSRNFSWRLVQFFFRKLIQSIKLTSNRWRPPNKCQNQKATIQTLNLHRRHNLQNKFTRSKKYWHSSVYLIKWIRDSIKTAVRLCDAAEDVSPLHISAWHISVQVYWIGLLIKISFFTKIYQIAALSTCWSRITVILGQTVSYCYGRVFRRVIFVRVSYFFRFTFKYS